MKRKTDIDITCGKCGKFFKSTIKPARQGKAKCPYCNNK